MNRLKTISIAAFLFMAGSGFCQVPADSLPGTYAGLLYYANPYTNPWTITPDTLYASNIDSANCKVQVNYSPYFGYPTYYTDYYSCNGIAPSNYYTKFYSGDSVRVINDQVAEPPPSQPISYRFYGKRISNKIVGINELLRNERINVYPNPSNGKFTIYNLQNTIYNLNLYNIFFEKIFSDKIEYCTSYIVHHDLLKGIYFLEISNEKEFIAKKIIIN